MENCYGRRWGDIAQSCGMADAPTIAHSTATSKEGARQIWQHPPNKKEKIQDVSDTPQIMAMGGRTKKRRTRLDIFSEKAAELFSQLQETHITAVLQTDQRTSRTIEEYVDSGLRTIDINKDHPAFPPVGFALFPFSRW